MFVIEKRCKQKPAGNKYECALLGKFADMNDLLDSNVYVGAGSKMLLWTIRLKYWAKTKVTTGSAILLALDITKSIIISVLLSTCTQGRW